MKIRMLKYARIETKKYKLNKPKICDEIDKKLKKSNENLNICITCLHIEK